MNAEAPFRRILGRILSAAIILAAVLLAWAVAADLRNNPRTDDAQVRANVIGVAPQVGGAVKEIHVVDNQAVRRGDFLMELDARPSRGGSRVGPGAPSINRTGDSSR